MRPKRSTTRGDQAIDGLGVGDVADDRDAPCRRRDLRGGLLERRLLAAGDDDLGAALGEPLGDGPADAAAAAGDEHDLVGDGK